MVGRLTISVWYLGTSTSKSTSGEDHVDQVKMVVDQVKQRRWKTW
jgi:hypothetical protein